MDDGYCPQALIAYLFGKELKDTETGLVAAALMAIVPGGLILGGRLYFRNEDEMRGCAC